MLTRVTGYTHYPSAVDTSNSLQHCMHFAAYPAHLCVPRWRRLTAQAHLRGYLGFKRWGEGVRCRWQRSPLTRCSLPHSVKVIPLKPWYRASVVHDLRIRQHTRYTAATSHNIGGSELGSTRCGVRSTTCAAQTTHARQIMGPGNPHLEHVLLLADLPCWEHSWDAIDTLDCQHTRE